MKYVLPLLFLCVATNACAIAKYDLISLPSPERGTSETLIYVPPVSFILPSYYLMHQCDSFSARQCRNQAGEEIYKGVTTALDIAGVGGEFIEHTPSKGLVCVVTVKQESPEDYTSRLWSMATMFVVPAYTRREYILSYDVYLDFRPVREYRFNITEKAFTGVAIWLFAPVVPFLNDVTIGQEPGIRGAPGPMSYVVQKATNKFLEAAYQDGVFSQAIMK